MREFFDITTGKHVDLGSREVKERLNRGEVLISNKEASQEVARVRARQKQEGAKRNEYVAGRAAYLLANGEKNVAKRIASELK